MDNFTEEQLKMLSEHINQEQENKALREELMSLPDYKSHIDFVLFEINAIVNKIDKLFTDANGYNMMIPYNNPNCLICNSLFDALLVKNNYLVEMLEINKYSASKISDAPFTIWNLIFIFKKHYLADKKFHKEFMRLRQEKSILSGEIYDLYIKKYADKLNLNWNEDTKQKIVDALFKFYPDFANFSTGLREIHIIWIKNCKEIFSKKHDEFIKWLNDLELLKK